MSTGESHAIRRVGQERGDGGSQCGCDGVRCGWRSVRASWPDEATTRRTTAPSDGVTPVPVPADGVTPVPDGISIPLWGSKAEGAGGANEGSGGLVVDWRAGATASPASFAAVVPAGIGTDKTS